MFVLTELVVVMLMRQIVLSTAQIVLAMISIVNNLVRFFVGFAFVLVVIARHLLVVHQVIAVVFELSAVVVDMCVAAVLTVDRSLSAAYLVERSACGDQDDKPHSHTEGSESRCKPRSTSSSSPVLCHQTAAVSASRSSAAVATR